VRFQLPGAGRFVSAVLAALATATIAAAQQNSTEARITGCLQRAPASVERQGRFMLLNASNSPLGGSATQDVAPTAVRPEPSSPEPAPIQHRATESDARQETGGVDYLLIGGSDLESKIGQRVEVTGAIGSEVKVPPTRPSAARPMRTVQVKRVRAIKPSC